MLVTLTTLSLDLKINIKLVQNKRLRLTSKHIIVIQILKGRVLVLLDPNGKGVVRAMSKGLDMALQ